MSYAYLIPSFVTGIITFSWYTSHYGRPQIPGSEPRANFSLRRYDDDDDDGRGVKAKHHVPPYMWDIYRNGIANDGNVSGPDIVKSIKPRFLGSPFRSRLYPNHGKQEVEFGVPEAGHGEHLTGAEIRITTRGLRRFGVTFRIYRRDWVLLDAKPSAVGDEWISLNVTSSVRDRDDPKAVSFVVVSTFNDVKIHGYKLAKRAEPVLLLSYRSEDSAKRVRKKRDVAEDYEEVTNRIWRGRTARSTCRRKPLYVDFSDIDYDTWIVAPAGYEAFQCVGKCTFPVSEHLSPTKHAIVQTLLHHVSPGKVGRACCVPTRLEPISILYVDTEGILTYRFRYQDMVVAECGCR